MSKMVIQCTSCKSKLRIADNLNKREVICPKCQSKIKLPGHTEPPKVFPPQVGTPNVLPQVATSDPRPIAPQNDSESSTGSMMDNPYGTPVPMGGGTTPGQQFATPTNVPVNPVSSFTQGSSRELVVFDNKKTIMGDRYYLTYWYENAGGFAARFLEEVRSCITASKFPEVRSQPVTATNNSAGCLNFLFPSFKFDALAFWSHRQNLEHFRCLYKAVEFGNVLHISLIFYNHFDLGCNQGCSSLLNLGKKGDDIEKAEYEEAFTRFIWMVLLVASENLGVKPIKSEVDERRKKGSGFTSGVKSLFGGK